MVNFLCKKFFPATCPLAKIHPLQTVGRTDGRTDRQTDDNRANSSTVT